MRPTQILFLHLHFRKGRSQSSHHRLVGHIITLDLSDDAKVEDEFVARVFFVVEADGETEDAVPAAGGADGDVAVAEGLPGDDEFGYGGEVYEGRRGDGGFGDDASGWLLMDDFDSWDVSVNLSEG